MSSLRLVGSLVLFAVSCSPALGQTVTQLWANNCASCHGRDASGGDKAKSLLRDGLFDQQYDRPFYDAIREGVKGVDGHAFGATLSDPQVWGLVVHLRELQARDLRRRVGGPKSEAGVYTTRHHKYRIEDVVTSGLSIPWAVEFLPDGRMLITERPGTLRVNSKWTPGGTLSGPVQGVPPSVHLGQGGLMDVALHPEFAKNGWVYLGFNEPAPGVDAARRGGRSMTSIIRGRLKDVDGKTTWTDQEVLFRAKPEHTSSSGVHFGNRIVFEPAYEKSKDGRYHMYFSIGERGNGPQAQDLTRPNGKIHRLWDDGKVPDDNPFVSRADAYPSIWSYGHRNPQGLVFDLNGALWDTEHGPRGGDELNLIQKGGNYGWPEVAFSINYSDMPYATPWAANGKAKDGATIIMPVDRWLPSIAACGLDVVRGEAFPKWKGDLVAGGLAGANVDRVRIKDGKVVEREEIFFGHGRVRDVVTAPDGTVYVVLNDPDKVVRLVPAD
jgi:glucose/arabinose dehydrogenase